MGEGLNFGSSQVRTTCCSSTSGFHLFLLRRGSFSGCALLGGTSETWTKGIWYFFDPSWGTRTKLPSRNWGIAVGHSPFLLRIRLKSVLRINSESQRYSCAALPRPCCDGMCQVTGLLLATVYFLWLGTLVVGSFSHIEAMNTEYIFIMAITLITIVGAMSAVYTGALAPDQVRTCSCTEHPNAAKTRCKPSRRGVFRRTL